VCRSSCETPPAVSEFKLENFPTRNFLVTANFSRVASSSGVIGAKVVSYLRGNSIEGLNYEDMKLFQTCACAVFVYV
jgi:hypothetical protein